MSVCADPSQSLYWEDIPLVGRYRHRIRAKSLRPSLQKIYALTIGLGHVTGHGWHLIFYDANLVSLRIFSYHTILSNRKFGRFRPCRYSL